MTQCRDILMVIRTFSSIPIDAMNRTHQCIRPMDFDFVCTGAHSIGRSHCTSFSNRLYSFNSATGQDPSLDADYADQLKQQCPQGSTNRNLVVPINPSSPTSMDTGYYADLLENRGLFISDQTLMTDASTAGQVTLNALSGSLWRANFAEAMLKMSLIDVLTGDDGEIRLNCRAIN